MIYKSITTTTILAVALAASTATAQSVDIATNIAENLLGFRAQNLIPRPVESDELELTSALTLSFGGSNVTSGQSFTLPADQSTLAEAPTFQLDVPQRYAQRYAQRNFTAIICDPGSISNLQPGNQVTRHYLANGMRWVDGRLQETQGAITSYNAPGPAGDGVHRYLALVFSQVDDDDDDDNDNDDDDDDDFEAPNGLSGPTPLGNMSLSDYIDDSDLGPIIALTYILVENTSDGTVPTASTTAVPSASVAAAASSIASSLGLALGPAGPTGSVVGGGGVSSGGGPNPTSASTPGSTSGAGANTGPANAAAPGLLGAKGTALSLCLGAVGVAVASWAL